MMFSNFHIFISLSFFQFHNFIRRKQNIYGTVQPIWNILPNMGWKWPSSWVFSPKTGKVFWVTWWRRQEPKFLTKPPIKGPRWLKSEPTRLPDWDRKPFFVFQFLNNWLREIQLLIDILRIHMLSYLLLLLIAVIFVVKIKEKNKTSNKHKLLGDKK